MLAIKIIIGKKSVLAALLEQTISGNRANSKYYSPLHQGEFALI